MREPGFVVDVIRVLGEVWFAEHAAQLGELAVIATGDDDVAVGDRKHLIGRDVGVRVAHAVRHLAGDQIIERLVGKDGDGRVDERGIDIAATPGFLPPRQRGENADHRIDAGENIGHRHAGAQRLAVGIAGEIHEAADALRHQIVARTAGIGSVLAEAGHRAIDQPRHFRRETFVVEAEFGEPADLEILDQHVGTCGEFSDDPPAFLALEVELDGTLAAIGAVKIGGAEMAAVGGRNKRRAPGAGVVAGALALDLDHVGAEIGQDLPGPRPCQDASKLQDAQTGQRT